MIAAHVKKRRCIFSLAFLLLFAAFAFLIGCATTPEPEPAETTSEDAEADPDAASEEPVDTPEQEPAETPEPDEQPAEEPEEEPEAASDGDYEVSEEVYNQTFSEVEQTIQELNRIIRDKDFDEWRSYLTDAYEDEYSDPERLREISDMPILQRNEIVLESLQDYFRWVVVPSRANARLDDLRFVTKSEVEAIMSVNGQRVILYHLKKVDGSWKIDTS
jgi:hypothetical protein